MSLAIRQCSILELENQPNIMALLDEYADESAIIGLPHPSANVATYKQLESVGAIYFIGAFFDHALIGFIAVLSPVLPHYGKRVAVAESYFVSKQYRKTGAGLKLLREAERYAGTVGSCGILVSAPTGGDLAEVLPRVGYAETNRVYFRNFTDE